VNVAILAAACVSVTGTHAQSIVAKGNDHITFQTYAPWSSYINLAADTAMVYEIDDTMPSRIRS
jgi:hypothetical protein